MTENMSALEKLLKCKHRRPDNFVTPLIIQTASLVPHYTIERTAECCLRYYQGQDTYIERYGKDIAQREELYRFQEQYNADQVR